VRIGSHFPVVSPNQNNQTGRVLTDQGRNSATPSREVASASDVASFETLFAQQPRFQKIDSLSWLAQNALSAYQATQSLSADNPRNQLIGVDVFA
jgi:hypothetical protein